MKSGAKITAGVGLIAIAMLLGGRARSRGGVKTPLDVNRVPAEDGPRVALTGQDH